MPSSGKAGAWLITVNLAVSVLVWVCAPFCWYRGLGTQYAADMLSLPSEWPEATIRPWSFLTYMFTQFSPLHLVVNLLWLWWSAGALSERGSQGNIIWTYLVSGLAGGLSYLAVSGWTGRADAVLSGASSAVLGLMCAMAVCEPRRRIHFLFLGSLQLRWVVLAVVLLYMVPGGGGWPVPAAHLAGAVAGAVFFAAGILMPGKTSNEINRVRKPGNIRFVRTIEAMKRSESDEEILDRLLDKVRSSGYGSLSQRERIELDAVSNRLKL